MIQRATKTARLGLFIEPDLRSAIEREARRRQVTLSGTVRTMLREQVASLAASADGRGQRADRRSAP